MKNPYLIEWREIHPLTGKEETFQEWAWATDPNKAVILIATFREWSTYPVEVESKKQKKAAALARAENKQHMTLEF